MAQIIKARKAKKLSQAILAKKVSVTKARIVQIESKLSARKVSLELLLAIRFICLMV